MINKPLTRSASTDRVYVINGAGKANANELQETPRLTPLAVSEMRASSRLGSACNLLCQRHDATLASTPHTIFSRRLFFSNHRLLLLLALLGCLLQISRFFLLIIISQRSAFFAEADGPARLRSQLLRFSQLLRGVLHCLTHSSHACLRSSSLISPSHSFATPSRPIPAIPSYSLSAIAAHPSAHHENGFSASSNASDAIADEPSLPVGGRGCDAKRYLSICVEPRMKVKWDSLACPRRVLISFVRTWPCLRAAHCAFEKRAKE